MKNSVIFASTILATTHQNNALCRVFYRSQSFTKDNTLLRPLSDAHLGSFLIFKGDE